MIRARRNERQGERRAHGRVARGREQPRGCDECEEHREVDVRVEPGERGGDVRGLEAVDERSFHVQRQRTLETQHVVSVGEGRRDVAFDRNANRMPGEQHERDERELGLHRVRPPRISRCPTHPHDEAIP